MKNILNNPVYHSLISGDRHLSSGTEKVKFFNEDVSPFAGFEDDYEHGFEDLYNLLPPGRRMLYASPQHITEHKGWKLIVKIPGLQFIAHKLTNKVPGHINLVPLHDQYIDQMLELTKLTKPGPFGVRTIEFGNYFGIFDNEKLVAMTGQRLHVNQFTEISAVCTDPAYLGRGYASALLRHQVQLIVENNQVPFLHVREDNSRAIKMYEYLGFKISGPMNFYFLEKTNGLNS